MLGSLRAATTMPRSRITAGSSSKTSAAILRAAAFSTTTARRQATPAPEPPKMVKLTVDGKEVEVEQGYVFTSSRLCTLTW